MNIPELMRESHSNAIERGFYPEGENKNIGELLMLIVSELGEALEAHRCGRFAEKELIDCLPDEGYRFEYAFENQIKDTFEDELADVFIRLFDLCGYLIESEHNIIIENCFAVAKSKKIENKNVGSWMFDFITYNLKMTKFEISQDWIPAGALGETLGLLFSFCQSLNIPIEKHIKAKMAYNRTRKN